MQLILGYETLESYQRLSYKHWYAFAEFIDNSTQSYRNNKIELDEAYAAINKDLFVSITYSNGKDKFIKIEDNAYGMSYNELTNALTLGKRPSIDNERSKYGLGLKTAAFWFGNSWTIETAQLGSGKKYSVTVDLNNILADEKKHYEKIKEEGGDIYQFIPQLPIDTVNCSTWEFGTTITITSLNKPVTPQVAKNCVSYLQSIFRIDLEKKILDLRFQGVNLSWDRNEIESRLLIDEGGEKMKRDFKTVIAGKYVKGWVGVLETGGRKDAGFALLQADRVIMGYPNNYRPTLLFGEDPGGSNNLVNQRLVGEIELDGFDVSHTKDQILFNSDEEEILNVYLYEHFADFKKAAETYRVQKNKGDDNFDFDICIDSTLRGLDTSAFKDELFRASVLPIEVIEKSNEEVIDRISRIGKTKFVYKIEDLTVSVLASDESSPYDPYLIVKTAARSNHLTIVINKTHSYWNELNDKVSMYNFLVSCIFDGLSEWKAQFLVDDLSPSTIKNIKDRLLRLPLRMH